MQEDSFRLDPGFLDDGPPFRGIGLHERAERLRTPLGGGSGAGRAFSQRNYGMDLFADLFTNRQLLAITTLARLVRTVDDKLRSDRTEQVFADAVQTVLAQVVNKQADYDTSLCSWHYHNREKVNHTFHRQAIPIVWDFVEPVFFGSGAGSWPGLFDWTMQALENPVPLASSAHVQLADAADHPLPNDSAQAFVTDPPYYDAVPYSDLSDFFYVWFKRTLPENAHHGFASILTPKKEECIVDEVKGKDAAYFEATMKRAMTEGRRVLAPTGVGIVVFAHKSTKGWEAQLQAMVDAGWIITGSWPIDTEMGTRLRAQASAALASSVHLVCRPRKKPDGSVRTDEIGDWRDVLQELPRRIHEWMPRLAEEGGVGADAIFACLGPALEIFSRYSHVEKASGETVSLKEYLEQV
jgi:putative DNA methylase